MRGSVDSYSTSQGRRWRIRWDLPPDRETGERRRGQRRGFATKREASKALTEELARVDGGHVVASDKLTVRQWLEDEWLPSRKPRDGAARGHRGQLSLSTWSQYRTYVKAYVVPHVGHLALQQLSATDLNRLYDVLEHTGGRRGDGLAAKTLANLHGLLHKALVDAVKRGRITRNVADQVDPPTADRTVTRWWSIEELRRFVQHVEDDPFFAAWLLFATTGMRRGEVAGLAWEDVDLDAGSLTVRWQLGLIDNRPTFKPRPKSRAGRRTMALDPATVEALREHRRRQLEHRLAAGDAWAPVVTDHLGTSRAGLVFTWPDGNLINPERLTTWFKAHCRAAELSAIRLHDVRHSYASVGLASATGWHEVKVISERLGHANVAITLDTYSHVLPAADEATAHTLAKLILGGS